jgi:hypothetical protein
MIKSIVQKLKEKWKIASNLDLLLIMLVFSLAGVGVSLGRKPIFALLGITSRTPLWIKICVYLPLVVPLYQISLVFFGFLLGQFDFFWNKQKQTGRILRDLIFRKDKASDK